jgi:hypothetical protein
MNWTKNNQDNKKGEGNALISLSSPQVTTQICLFGLENAMSLTEPV